MLTRPEASKELKKRGYKEDEEPGIWMSPDGSRLAWFIALQRESIKFDSKTWGAEMTRLKYEWKEKKRLAKLKLKNSIKQQRNEIPFVFKTTQIRTVQGH